MKITSLLQLSFLVTLLLGTHAHAKDNGAEKRKIMNTFVQFINTADEKLSKQLVSDEAIFYVPGQTEPLHGPQGYMQVIGMMRAGFPDIQWKLEDIVVENDVVATRYTMEGTHNGTFFGVPASGKKIKAQAMNFYFFKKGKLVKEFGQPDLLELLKQIGAIPGSKKD
jgi:steroid delta-isomerase-like uncharacterized protein